MTGLTQHLGTAISVQKVVEAEKSSPPPSFGSAGLATFPSTMRWMAIAPAHMAVSAVQAVKAKIDPPVTPAPTAHPPASIPPKPISTAPTK